MSWRCNGVVITLQGYVVTIDDDQKHIVISTPRQSDAERLQEIILEALRRYSSGAMILVAPEIRPVLRTLMTLGLALLM